MVFFTLSHRRRGAVDSEVQIVKTARLQESIESQNFLRKKMREKLNNKRVGDELNTVS